MKLDERVICDIEELISLGEEVISTQRRTESMGRLRVVAEPFVDGQLSAQWGTRSLSLLERIFSKDSIYYETYYRISNSLNKLSNVKRGMGILQAAKVDVEKGGLIKLKDLTRAELFDNLLEQSEYLLDCGYYTAAVVLSGAVLENQLRELSIQHHIELPAKPKLDSMNIELVKKGVYNITTQKRITGIAGIRNSAAHGKESEYTKEDVVDMVKHIRRLIEEWV